MYLTIWFSVASIFELRIDLISIVIIMSFAEVE